MRVHWQTFEQDGQLVEAQVFRGDVPSDKLIIFCPGFPGLGGSLFEQRHAGALADAGFDVVVIKHAGSKLDAPLSPLLVNHSARLQQAYKTNEKYLGGGPSTARAWLCEPLIVLNHLHVQYAQIDFIGNSFGAVAALWSLCADAPLQRVRNLICFAGAQGVDDGAHGIMRIWSLAFLSAPFLWETITLDGPQNVHDTMRAAYAHIASHAGALPEHIGFKYVVVSNDELFTVQDSENFKNLVMRGRGDIIIDDMEHAYPALNLTAHYTPNYPTDKLLELLK